jgi:hypothetical protein
VVSSVLTGAHSSRLTESSRADAGLKRLAIQATV